MVKPETTDCILSRIHGWVFLPGSEHRGLGILFSSAWTQRVTVPGTILGGLLTGSAVCGMHYLGQGGIANYSLFLLGGSYVFRLCPHSGDREHPGAVNIFLLQIRMDQYLAEERGVLPHYCRLAFSGMHWCATRGTHYRLKSVGKAHTLPPNHVINAVTVLVSF